MFTSCIVILGALFFHGLGFVNCFLYRTSSPRYISALQLADFDVSVENVKELRKRSGASIALCRQALLSENGVMERAFEKVRLMSLDEADRLHSRYT
jgi:hypothetical protein